jgi:predicted SnoaL-like aldol condensation-catalyzing enzyme
MRLSLLSAGLLAPLTALAAPATDAAGVPYDYLNKRENLCNLSAPPVLCVPNASVTPEETAIRAYKFYRAFVVDGDPRTMFSLIDNEYIQHNPGYRSGPQAIWSLFCAGRKIGTEQSTSHCFVPSTNMSYARYATIDRWRWVGGCVHEHWDQGERFPPADQCAPVPAAAKTP